MALILGSASCGSDDGSTDSSTEVVTTTSAVPVETLPVADAVVPVVVDTDLAADDIVALTYLLSNPAVDVLAVTVSGTGEVTCPRGAEVASGLLSSLGHDDVPVACGQSAPLSGDRVFPEEWRTAADDAYGLSLPVIEPSTELDAVELLVETVDAAPAPVTLLTLGPLTNVAQAFASEPGLADSLGALVMMGGAVDVAGNVQLEGSDNPLAAEWNLYIDPAASDAVISSGAPVTLVALDATNQVPVTSEFIDRLAANDTTDATALVAEILAASSPPYLWDALAAIAAAEPALVPGTQRSIAVVTEGEDAGRTIEQADGSAVLVADPPDAEAVLDHLLRTLVGVDSDDELVTPTTVPVVGEATLSFDGTTCTYTGPTSLPEGMLRLTVTPGPVPYLGVVSHLVEGATLDEALAWLAEHPGEQPPMVDSAEAVGEDATPSPATVALLPGLNPVVCITSDALTTAGGMITVNGGS
jgi:inosine-uridine nucleoside N-ribohydrolase